MLHQSSLAAVVAFVANPELVDDVCGVRGRAIVVEGQGHFAFIPSPAILRGGTLPCIPTEAIGRSMRFRLDMCTEI